MTVLYQLDILLFLQSSVMEGFLFAMILGAALSAPSGSWALERADTFSEKRRVETAFPDTAALWAVYPRTHKPLCGVTLGSSINWKSFRGPKDCYFLQHAAVFSMHHPELCEMNMLCTDSSLYIETFALNYIPPHLTSFSHLVGRLHIHCFQFTSLHCTTSLMAL